MGIYFTREKTDYLKYEGRYVYCETCLAKIPFNHIYIMAHCLNKTHIIVVVNVMGIGFMKIVLHNI